MEMNRDKKLKKQRADYVKAVVNKSDSTVKAVAKLSKRLFVSEKTIYRDLKL